MLPAISPVKIESDDATPEDTVPHNHLFLHAGTLPSFSHCTKLVEFYCHHNSFEGAAPEFRNPELSKFVCSDNRFSTKTADWYGGVGHADSEVLSESSTGVTAEAAKVVKEAAATEAKAKKAEADSTSAEAKAKAEAGAEAGATQEPTAAQNEATGENAHAAEETTAAAVSTAATATKAIAEAGTAADVAESPESSECGGGAAGVEGRKRHLTEAFARLDRDGKGHITAADHARSYTEQGIDIMQPRVAQHMASQFAALDTEGVGRVTCAQYVAASEGLLQGADADADAD